MTPVDPRPGLLHRAARERAILDAITAGATMTDLMRRPKWTVREVSDAIQRHSLVVADSGQISRSPNGLQPTPLPPGMVIAQCAAEAAAQLTELRRALELEIGQPLTQGMWIRLLSKELADARLQVSVRGTAHA